MKKRFLLVPLVVGVAGASWAGGTLYGGGEARQAYDRMLADVGTASGLSLVPRSYEAGFLQSEAVTELRAGAGDEAETLLRFRHVIEHSPVGDAGLRAARIVTTVDTAGLDPELAAQLGTLFGGASPLVVDSIIGLGGAAEHAVTVAAWTHESAMGPVVASPMEWSIRQSADAVSGTGRWPGLTVTAAPGATAGPGDPGGDARLTFGASHDRFDYRKAGDGLYVGEYVAELGDLEGGSVSTGMAGSLSGMRLSSTTEVVGDAYRGDMAFDIASIDLPVELDSLNLHARFDGMPVAGVAAANRATTSLEMSRFADDPAAVDAAVAGYLEALGSVLRPGLSVSYGVELANAGGRAAADFDMDWVGNAAGVGLAGIETLGDLGRAFRASAKLDVDADALAMTPAAMFLDPASLAPWITSDADGYRADVTVENLVMDINGMEIPLEAMAGGMLERSLKEIFAESM